MGYVLFGYMTATVFFLVVMHKKNKRFNDMYDTMEAAWKRSLEESSERWKKMIEFERDSNKELVNILLQMRAEIEKEMKKCEGGKK